MPGDVQQLAAKWTPRESAPQIECVRVNPR